LEGLPPVLATLFFLFFLAARLLPGIRALAGFLACRLPSDMAAEKAHQILEMRVGDRIDQANDMPAAPIFDGDRILAVVGRAAQRLGRLLGLLEEIGGFDQAL
jgi:hypothetical protein